MRYPAAAFSAIGLACIAAGCEQDAQYPNTAYAPGYGYSSGYSYPGYPSPRYVYGSSYGRNTAYSTYSPAYATGYGTYQAQPRPTRSERYWKSAHRDYDRDGIPNRYDRDANGDGIPDRYQARW